MTNIDLLKQKLSILASSGVLSDSVVSTIDETVKALDESEPVVHCRECVMFRPDRLFTCKIYNHAKDENWFCADGKRRREAECESD